MNTDEIYQEIEKQANNVLVHLKQSTKNIEWTMKIEIQKWDCQIKFQADYLDCHSIVYSPSMELDKAISDSNYIPSRFAELGDYVLRVGIRNMAEKLFIK